MNELHVCTFTFTLEQELSRHHVRFNLLCPPFNRKEWYFVNDVICMLVKQN